MMIAGGGTGGHVIPALCVADSLSDRGVTVQFVGSTTGIEAELVPAAGYTLHSLPLRGLSGGLLSRAQAGLLFVRALGSCRRLIRTFRPHSVLGVGGYASAPAVLAARSLNIPTLLHEQNSVPGKVNRFASRFTREVLVTFPAASKYFPDAVEVGMPTRPQFFQVKRDEALKRLGLEPPVVLIFGGSGGAIKLNLAAVEAFGRDVTPYSVVQIAGRRDFSRLHTSNPRHRVVEYDPEIWQTIAAADVVVSRAGAGSLFDIAAVGRAAILVPFPYAAGDHQMHNARYFTEQGAAELLLDSEVSSEILRAWVERLLHDEARRTDLAARIHGLATLRAANEVAQRLLGATEISEKERV